ncbi:MAG: hypothetical protein ACOC56_00305 [Atribacterota bacterium]
MGFDKLRKKIEKVVKGVHVSILSESDIAKIDTWIKTPSYDLNRVLSGSLHKGVPLKSHVVVVGPEASFKTSFICLCLRDASRKGLKPIIIDTEGACTTEFVSRWGLNPDEVLYIYSPLIDDVTTIVSNIATDTDTGYAIAIDSIGGLDRKKLIEDSSKGELKADQGILQKEIKRMLKLLVYACKSKNSVAFTTGHLYGNPSGYGSAEKVGGGNYLKLSADIIISLKKYEIRKDPSKKTKEGNPVVGTGLYACTLKNRFFPPYSEATIEINYTKGINPYAGLLDICEQAGIFKGAGAWYTYLRTGEKIQGKNGVIKYISENQNVIDEIDDFVKSTGYSTYNYELEMKFEDDEVEKETEFLTSEDIENIENSEPENL